MSEHKVTIDWQRETPDFAYETYNRDHDWVSMRGSRSGLRPTPPTWAASRASIPRRRSSPASRAATC